VVVAPPPTPIPPRAQSSNEDGTCGQGGVFDDQQQHVYDCSVIFSSDGLPIQFQVTEDGQEIGRDSGVQKVVFRVEQDGNTIYTNEEEREAYCIFGGDGPCNSWILENYVYKWGPGGPPIQPGQYKFNIDAFVEDPSVNLHWERLVTIMQ
jgi:hypothetical protein